MRTRSKYPYWRQARENACDQVAIGFDFASDWLGRWREFVKPIIERSKVKPKQFSDYFRQSIENRSMNTKRTSSHYDSKKKNAQRSRITLDYIITILIYFQKITSRSLVCIKKVSKHRCLPKCSNPVYQGSFCTRRSLLTILFQQNDIEVLSLLHQLWRQGQ